MNNFWNTQANLPLISLITSEVLAQTLQNLQGSRWNNIQCSVHILKKKKKKKKRLCTVVLIITITWSAGTVHHVPFDSSVFGRHKHSGEYCLSESGILDQTSHFQGSRRNGCEWCLHVKRSFDWDINEKRSSDIVTTSAQCFALITFEVLNQTPPNLLGSCRSSSRWCLQN